MKLIKILILEDDLGTISQIFGELAKLENKLVQEKGIEISTIVISESPHVETLINKNPSLDFDIFILDRDCKIGGSFHDLDIQKFGVKKIIGISSVPEYNDELVRQGITTVIHKDYRNLIDFSNKLLRTIEKKILED